MDQPHGRLIPRSRVNALATWRTSAARDIAGYLALVGGQALAVDVEAATGIPAKGMRTIVEKYPTAFVVAHEYNDTARRTFMVIALMPLTPRDLRADVARRLELVAGISGVDSSRAVCLAP